MSEKNIYQRINAVMKDVEYVQKDTTISGGGGYKAVSHDMVVAVIRKSMVSHGIVVRTEQLQSDMLQMRDKASGISMHLYSADYAIHFVNVDNPEDCCTVTINAHASDTGDKAPGKSASYAVKYAMLKTFSLETGENDESRTYEAPQFTDIQKDRFDFILKSERALDYVAFSATVGDAVMSALSGTFPEGKIAQGKALMKRLEKEGWDQLREYAGQIRGYIAENDTNGVLELVGELEPAEKKLVAGLLTADEVLSIKKIQELAA